MTTNELINTINREKIIQKGYFDDIEFSDDIEKELKNSELVESYLLTIQHRWYETSVFVFKHNNSGNFFGIRHVTNVFSENMSISDIDYILKAIPMKEITVKTYIKD